MKARRIFAGIICAVLLVGAQGAESPSQAASGSENPLVREIRQIREKNARLIDPCLVKWTRSDRQDDGTTKEVTRGIAAVNGLKYVIRTIDNRTYKIMRKEISGNDMVRVSDGVKEHNSSTLSLYQGATSPDRAPSLVDANAAVSYLEKVFDDTWSTEGASRWRVLGAEKGELKGEPAYVVKVGSKADAKGVTAGHVKTYWLLPEKGALIGRYEFRDEAGALLYEVADRELKQLSRGGWLVTGERIICHVLRDKKPAHGDDVLKVMEATDTPTFPEGFPNVRALSEGFLSEKAGATGGAGRR